MIETERAVAQPRGSERTVAVASTMHGPLGATASRPARISQTAYGVIVGTPVSALSKKRT